MELDNIRNNNSYTLFEGKFLHALNKLPSFTHFNSMFSHLYPLKTSENQSFSDVFREYRNGTHWVNMG